MESVVFPWQSKTAPSKTVESGDKPRVISEIKKNCFSKLRSSFWSNSSEEHPKPKISGKIFWVSSSEREEPRSAEVRQGSLFVFGSGSSRIEFRLPLRRLDLQPCNTPRTFRLSRGSGAPPLVFQALSDEEYEKWVKTLAVELIRQTPLQDLRFLDIISITRRSETEDKTRKKEGQDSLVPLRRSRSAVTLSESEKGSGSTGETERKRRWRKTGRSSENENRRAIEERMQDSKSSKIRRSNKTARPVLPFLLKSCKEEPASEESGIGSGDENPEHVTFVSVREKKRFFESLNREKEEDSAPAKTEETIVPVKEICRLFETEQHPQQQQQQQSHSTTLLNRRRLQRGERKLAKLRIQIAEVEETVETIAQDLRNFTRNFSQREEGRDIVAALQRRLEEENSRLERLHEETIRVIKENQRTLKKLAMKIN